MFLFDDGAELSHFVTFFLFPFVFGTEEGASEIAFAAARSVVGVVLAFDGSDHLFVCNLVLGEVGAGGCGRVLSFNE